MTRTIRMGVLALAVLGGGASVRGADPWVVYEGSDGPGKGKHIVLVSGDEEYRSEEGLPQLGKILAKRHGFKCTVLFAIDPTDGTINPNKNDNIPGLEALKRADLMIIATRFRNLPDEQMKSIVEYVESGRPIIGMRTATHAFNLKSKTYAKYSWRGNKDWPGGFGRHILGETWVDHWGAHGSQSTRGILAKGQVTNPILRGIKDGDIWGSTDVYKVNLPLPGDSKPLVFGQVLQGMKPTDPPVEGKDAKKNDPMMPIAWTKTYKSDSGKTGRVFTTTMGTAQDLLSEGLRRLLVNATYWTLGMEDKIPAKTTVDLVGEYKPRSFKQSFQKGVKPADLAIQAAAPAGVVSHVTVLSDKVPDVSNLEAWRKSFLKDGMTDQEKALAVWRSTVMFQHQDTPPREFLANGGDVQDPFKIFNVYGYSFCSVASCDIECLSRYAGLRAHGWGILNHSVPEVFWDGAWHLLDASLINYFPKKDGTLAGVEEIRAAITEWYDKHPGYKGDNAKLLAFQRTNGWTGWKQGPDLLAHCTFYDAGGWWPAKTHGWYATMQEYDGRADGSQTGKAFLYEYGYSQGYQVNIQLRPGEHLTRNWSNRGLHVNMKAGPAPGCLTGKTGIDSLAYTPKYGDLAPGRIGNGTLEYDVPVKSAVYRSGALTAENLDESAVRVRDAARPATLVLRMPSSYVYLTGTLAFKAAVGAGGSVTVSFSDNNGLDWKEVAKATASDEQRVNLSPLVLRRYDYRLKFVFRGEGTGLDALKVVHDIQHSQRPLPALDQGNNTITFSAGPAEGTVTVEGATNPAQKGKQLVYTDFHPTVSGFESKQLFIGATGKGLLTFPVATPGELVRLRFGAHYRARDARDGLDYQVSFDEGKSWKTVDRAAGPTPGNCKYVVFADVPAGVRQALVRYAGTSRNATGILQFRIDADYREPFGGFRPVRVTYTWEEDGQPKRDVHIARKPSETYTIRCAAKPVMKSIVLEVAE